MTKGSAYTLKSRAKHLESYLAYQKLYQDSGKQAQAQKKHRLKRKLANPRYYADQAKAWRKKNPEKWRVIMCRAVRKRRRVDPVYRLKGSINARINRLLKSVGGKKGRVVDLLGVDLAGLKSWIEARFTSGMTWENQGRFGWHVDHIKPCSSFDLLDPEEVKICFHHTNLQPLWWFDNLAKSDKICPSLS